MDILLYGCLSFAAMMAPQPEPPSPSEAADTGEIDGTEPQDEGKSDDAKPQDKGKSDGAKTQDKGKSDGAKPQGEETTTSDEVGRVKQESHTICNEILSQLEDSTRTGERWRQRKCARARRRERLARFVEAHQRGFAYVMKGVRESRCATAICMGPYNMWAIEPMAEIPVGTIIAAPRSSLAQFINGNDVSVTFTAGLRFWVLWDWISFDIHLSKPVYPSDKTIRIAGSEPEYDATSVRRATPGLGIGFFGDVLWLGIDYDQLRHRASSTSQREPFRDNDVITGAVVFTVAIAPIAALRNGIGAATNHIRNLPNAAKQSNGAATPPNGAATPPNGAATPPNGAATPPNGAATPPNGAATPPNGAATPPNGAATPPNGAATPPNGAATPPNGAATPLDDGE